MKKKGYFLCYLQSIQLEQIEKKRRGKSVWPANNAIGGVRHVAGGLVLAVVPVE